MPGKEHRKPKVGRKAEKKTDKKKATLSKEEQRKQNPRAFAFQSAGAAKSQRARSAEKAQKRLHAPMLEKDAAEPPPFVVLVQGPPGVGKSTLIRCLVKQYARQNLGQVLGPITVVAGKKRRVTFVECPSDLCGMMDAAKYADLVLLLIDGSFGFEMETFEFLNLLQVHGFPKVMGVLTHLDGFKDPTALKKTKKKLKARFWSEIYDGAKLFYLSGIQHGRYLKREVLNLGRFIAVMKARPLTWRLAHPYVITDRIEDITPRELVRANAKVDREVVLYGYLRGSAIKDAQRVHIAGAGDFTVQELDMLPDPCPLPGSVKRRGLADKERLIYAPMADVGGVLYDKDAVYVDIPDWKVQYSKSEAGGPAKGAADAPGADAAADEGEAMVRGLQGAARTIDEALADSSIRIFPKGRSLKSADAADAPEEDEEDSERGSEEEDGDEEMADGEGSEWSDEEDEEEGLEAHADPRRALRSGMPASAPTAAANGRTRRAAVFNAAAAAGKGLAPGSDDEDEESNGVVGSEAEDGSEGEDAEMDEIEEEEQEEDEGMGAAARWKSSLALHAAAIFAARSADLAALVYGRRAIAADDRSDDEDDDAEEQAHHHTKQGLFDSEDGDDADVSGDDEDLLNERRRSNATASGSGSDSDNDDAFFTLKRTGSKSNAAAAGPGGGTHKGRRGGGGRGGVRSGVDARDAVDSSRTVMGVEMLAAWEDEEMVQSLRNRFVTGDWAEGAKRATARPGADGSDEEGDGEEGDEEAFGEFEDMETGEAFKGGQGDAITAAAQRAITLASQEELREMRAAKKAAFDAEYDTKGAKGVTLKGDEDVEEGGKAGGKAKSGRLGPQDEETYYDAIKREMSARQAATRTLLDSMPAASRIAMEGHRVGTYVRMRFTGVPCELVVHHDPRRPVLVGGLAQGEEKHGIMKVRFKRHRWFPKLLKNRDPLIWSIGWRRFQAMPVYAVEDHNRRLRMLKYTPEHMHCAAVVWGPLAPPNSGVVAVQRLSDNLAGWRISGTGVVTELDAEVRVVKKLKLVGTPIKIHRHTAFIGGMFNSGLEVAKFEGASIRTVSGIRGTIKKALRPGVAGTKDGAFRASFEDKPLLSDIVFLRAWVAVPLPRFHNPVTNLLTALPAAPTQARAPKPGRRERSGDDEHPDEVVGGGFSGPSHADAGHDRRSTGGWTRPPLTGLAALLATPLLAADASTASAAVAKSSTLAPGTSVDFQRAVRFEGARLGYVFGKGAQGLGYYRDVGPFGHKAVSAAGPAAQAAGGSAAAASNGQAAAGGNGVAVGSGDVPGLVVMRTTAQLRRDKGEGAPREKDSLYAPIERAPRKFNPLKVPKALQAALPFKTKPKLEPARKRKTLEQKRAVVLEKGEQKTVALLQQLNAIRNDKAGKRREQTTRRRAEHGKKVQKEEAWRAKHNKEERKKRYREEAAVEKRKLLGQKRQRKE